MKRLCVCLLLAGALLFFNGGCQRDEGAPDFEYTTDMSGTVWTFYQYAYNNENDSVLRNDTIHFTSASDYTWNGVAGTYSMGGNSKYNTQYLNLWGTPFGTLHRSNWINQHSTTWHVKFDDGAGHYHYFW